MFESGMIRCPSVIHGKVIFRTRLFAFFEWENSRSSGTELKLCEKSHHMIPPDWQ